MIGVNMNVASNVSRQLWAFVAEAHFLVFLLCANGEEKEGLTFHLFFFLQKGVYVYMYDV